MQAFSSSVLHSRSHLLWQRPAIGHLPLTVALAWGRRALRLSSGAQGRSKAAAQGKKGDCCTACPTGRAHWLHWLLPSLCVQAQAQAPAQAQVQAQGPAQAQAQGPAQAQAQGPAQAQAQGPAQAQAAPKPPPAKVHDLI